MRINFKNAISDLDRAQIDVRYRVVGDIPENSLELSVKFTANCGHFDYA
jgi:hypothetical protein